MNRFGETIQKIHHYLEVIEASHVDSCRKRALFDALHWHTEVTDGGAESAGNFILFDEG